MSERRVLLVVGSESSGTRWMASAMLQAGCSGDGAHEQAFDAAIDEQNASWPARWPARVRRSYPHGDRWPDLSDLRRRIRERFDAETTIVAIHRNFDDAVRSKVRRGNCLAHEAEAETRFAFDELDRQLAEFDGAVVEVRYERLRLESERKRLFDAIGLPLPEGFDFRG